MTFSKDLILTLAILGVVLESDLGRKKIGWFRILRPIVIAAVIVPIYFKSLQTSGNDPVLESAGAVLGIVLGLLSVSPAFVAVGFEPDFRGWLANRREQAGTPAAVSVSGIRYATIWILASAARLAFAYGSLHLFPHALGAFLHKHQLTPAALTDALIFLPLGMDVFRSLGLFARRSSAMRSGRPLGTDVTGPMTRGRGVG